MNPIKKVYCRAFQTVLRLALPILPYRNPKVLDSVLDVPSCLKEKRIESGLIVTDGFLHISGMLEPLKKT